MGSQFFGVKNLNDVENCMIESIRFAGISGCYLSAEKAF